MKPRTKPISILTLLSVGILFFLFFTFSPVHSQETENVPLSNEQKIMNAMHAISSQTLFGYVKECCSEKYQGRLTGTPAYDASAQWIASLMNEWGIQPAGDNGTYFQDFPNPYTLILNEGNVTLHIPYKNNSVIDKTYVYETDYFPGGTSDSGEINAEVVYVGYSITAPELNYDDYKGMDVKGKIVLFEREVPVSPQKEPVEFKKWRPYSFHHYKVKNARDHGAAGVMFNYPIANPNCTFIKGLIVFNVGDKIVNDLFAGTGQKYDKVVESIDKTRKPHSFSTGKTMSLKASTQHHPEGIGKNVIGIIEGSDPELKKDVIMIGGHLDHCGSTPKLMPGANDNASAVAVMLGIAEAIHQSGVKPKRTIVFNFFGAEEQGVKGSEYYLNHPSIRNKEVKAFINMDGVGRGDKLEAIAGKNSPELWKHFEDANNKYIHRIVTPTYFANNARPRQDASHFMWAGIPTISFGTRGGDPLPFDYYHNSFDHPSIITPNIMQDLSRLIFLTVMEMAE